MNKIKTIMVTMLLVGILMIIIGEYNTIGLKYSLIIVINIVVIMMVITIYKRRKRRK